MLAGARVLLTGATGRLGRRVAEELSRSGCELVLVVRASSPEAARERVRFELPVGIDPTRLDAVCGDVTDPKLGLSLRMRARLRSSIDIVLHAAATTSFSSPLEASRSTNVTATENVLSLAEQATRLTRFAHVSTAFVAGKRVGHILESDLEHDCGFQNAYQQSKYEAELLVRRYGDVLPVTIFRPSIVLDGVGPDGPQQRSAFRFALDLVKTGSLSALPGSPATPVDLVLESDAARAIVRLLAAGGDAGTYHVAGGARAPTIGAILEPFHDVRYLSVDQFAWEVSKWRHEAPRRSRLYDELESFIYELAYPKVFDTTRADVELGGPVTTVDPLATLLGEGPSVVRRALRGARAQ